MYIEEGMGLVNRNLRHLGKLILVSFEKFSTSTKKGYNCHDGNKLCGNFAIEETQEHTNHLLYEYSVLLERF